MIRALTHADIPYVAELHSRVWGNQGYSLEELKRSFASFFPHVFLNPLLHDDEIQSLIYEDDANCIQGFLGVVRREMTFRGEPIRAAISSNMCVDTASRSRMAGVQLMKQFLHGAQDISIADMANASAQQVWEALGGNTSVSLTQSWVRVLRPASFLLGLAKQRPKLKPLAQLATPVAHLTDFALRNVPRNPLAITNSELHSCPLTPDLFLEQFDNLSGDFDVRPSYDTNSASWIWTRIDHLWDDGTAHQVACRTTSGQLAGWYVYRISSVGMAEVAHFVARKRLAKQVINHCFSHAVERGATAVTGRLLPNYFRALVESGCYFHGNGGRALYSARDQELANAFAAGNVFLSAFEGEGVLYHAVDPVADFSKPPTNWAASNANIVNENRDLLHHDLQESNYGNDRSAAEALLR